MSIRRNPNRRQKPWECRWLEDGKHLSRSFCTRKEAEQFDAERRAAARGGDDFYSKNERILLDDYAEKYLAQRKKPSTTLRNTDIYRRHIQSQFGALPIRRIRHSDVQKLVDTWVENGLSPRTVLRQLAVLSAIFTLAERDGVITRLPTKGVKCPGAAVPHRYAMSPDEVRLLQGAIHPNYQAFVYLLAETGMRIGEAISLNIEDFDWKSRTLKVASSKTQAGNRIVYISPTCRSLISAHIQSTGRTGANDSEPLFVSHRADKDTGLVIGARINYSNFRTRIFKAAASAIGLPGLQPHDLRRTAATLLVASGTPDKVIQAQLGHADIRTTLNLYAQTTVEARESAARTMEAALNPEPQPKNKEA